jgi:hypothetical protein
VGANFGVKKFSAISHRQRASESGTSIEFHIIKALVLQRKISI